MKNNWKWITGIIFALGAGFFIPHPTSENVGAASFAIPPTTETSMYISDPANTLGSQGLTVGTSGTTAHTILNNLCSGVIGPATLPATSTTQYSCAVPGLPSAVNLPASTTVFAMLNIAAQSNEGLDGIDIGGAGASTTAGYMSFYVQNASGVSTSSNQFANGVQYLITY